MLVDSCNADIDAPWPNIQSFVFKIRNFSLSPALAKIFVECVSCAGAHALSEEDSRKLNVCRRLHQQMASLLFFLSTSKTYGT